MKENGREPGSPGDNSEAGRHKLLLVRGFRDDSDFPGGSDPNSPFSYVQAAAASL
jgi:hypothetical protein